MMAKYLVPLSLLLVILIQRKANGIGCSTLERCLKENGNDLSNYEFKFDTLTEIKNIWGAMCRNTDSLTKCLTVASSGCFEIDQSNRAVFIMSATRATFQQICAKKDGMASLTHCMFTTLKGHTFQTCLKAKDPNDNIISKCGILLQTPTSKCYTDYFVGKCSQEVADFIKSVSGDPCSATNVIGQIVTVIFLLIMKTLIA